MAYMASKANWSDTETGAYQAAIPALGIAVTQSYPMPAGQNRTTTFRVDMIFDMKYQIPNYDPTFVGW